MARLKEVLLLIANDGLPLVPNGKITRWRASGEGSMNAILEAISAYLRAWQRKQTRGGYFCQDRDSCRTVRMIKPHENHIRSQNGHLEILGALERLSEAKKSDFKSQPETDNRHLVGTQAMGGVLKGLLSEDAKIPTLDRVRSLYDFAVSLGLRLQQKH